MESVVRGLAVYIFLLIVMRLAGRRALSQMTPFDLVLLLIVAETTQQALLGDDFSLTNAFVLILTLFAADIALSLIKRRAPKITQLLDGTPSVLLSHGEPDWEALRYARVDIGEVLEAARVQQGLERLEQVRFAVLEVGGKISIVPEQEDV